MLGTKFVIHNNKKIPRVKISKMKLARIFENTQLKPDDIYKYIRKHDYQNIKQCLSTFGNANDQLENDFSTPLLLAIQNECSKEIILTILEYGGSVLTADINGKNYMDYAISYSTTDYLLFLMEHIYKNAQLLLTDLCLASKLENGIIKQIVSDRNNFSEHRARDIILKKFFTHFNRDGDTIIMRCILKKKYFHLEFILNHLPQSTKKHIVNYKNPTDGKTALYIVGETYSNDGVKNHQYSEIFTKLLLQHGANPHIKNFSGYDCFDYNIRTQNKKIHKLLLSHRV